MLKSFKVLFWLFSWSLASLRLRWLTHLPSMSQTARSSRRLLRVLWHREPLTVRCQHRRDRRHDDVGLRALGFAWNMWARASLSMSSPPPRSFLLGHNT